MSAGLFGGLQACSADGDQHRYHSADRNAYSGVRAYWHDKNGAEKKSVLVGTEENEKRLKDTYGSEADALAAARMEMEARAYDLDLDQSLDQATVALVASEGDRAPHKNQDDSARLNRYNLML